MEYFFYNDDFCDDLSDLMCRLDMDEDDLEALPDDWSVNCEATTLEKSMVFKTEKTVDFFMDQVENNLERLPEDYHDTWEKIKKAATDAIEKLNEAMPSFYYPNGQKFVVTKADLIEWCK